MPCQRLCWFRPNVWPAEAPEPRPVVSDYIGRMHALSDELMVLCVAALGLPPGLFAPFLNHPTYGVNLRDQPRSGFGHAAPPRDQTARWAGTQALRPRPA